MTAGALYVLGTLLTWLGYAAALRALYLGLRLLDRSAQSDAPGIKKGALLALIFAGIALFAGSEIASSKGLYIPLAWIVMPFTGWAVLTSLVFMILRLIEAAGGLNSDEQRARLKAAGIWAISAVVFAYLFRGDDDAKIEFVKGAIPLSLNTALALVALAVAAVVAMVVTGRAARARGLAKAAMAHLALIVGSMLFGLPFAWLIITSFKEDIDMSSPNGIVWVPRVQETTPYLNKEKPLYTAKLNGTDVQGRVIEKYPDGRVKLDINKPISLRGTTMETPAASLKKIPIDAPIVDVEMNGQTVRGMVVEEMEDGHKRVQVLSPAEMKGRLEVYAPAEVKPVRKIGLRTSNYSDALDYLPPEANRGIVYVRNTIVIVVFGLLGTILSSAIVAYAFSRMRFPGRDLLFTLMLATMMLPGAVTKLPQFMIFKQLGWIDTLYPLWVPAFFGSAFNIFMLRQFFKQIPMELEDAAKIDGASYLRTFWSVMLPQIKPALAVIAIMTFVASWNNFLDPLIYINSPENMTISYAVQLYASDRSTEPGLLTAFTTMSMLPVLALFFFAQKYFIEGVTLSGMGGR